MTGSSPQTTGNPLDRLDAEQRETALLTHIAREVGDACQSFLAMTPHHITRQSKPPTGPRQWKRKINSTPAPSLKPDWPAIVAAACKAGLVKRPSKP